MSGFWVSPYLQSIEADMKLVVMNNHGGQIFSRMFNSSLFLNSHNLNFKPLAEMWGWDYQQTCDASKLKNISQMELIEINPDSSETQSFWDQYDQLWKK